MANGKYLDEETVRMLKNMYREAAVADDKVSYIYYRRFIRAFEDLFLTEEEKAGIYNIRNERALRKKKALENKTEKS